MYAKLYYSWRRDTDERARYMSLSDALDLPKDTVNIRAAAWMLPEILRKVKRTGTAPVIAIHDLRLLAVLSVRDYQVE